MQKEIIKLRLQNIYIFFQEKNTNKTKPFTVVLMWMAR